MCGVSGTNGFDRGPEVSRPSIVGDSRAFGLVLEDIYPEEDAITFESELLPMRSSHHNFDVSNPSDSS